MVFFQLLGAIGLGLFVTWLFRLWSGLFDNLYIAAAIWISACGLYAFIYDRRQARMQRSSAATKLETRQIEH